MCQGELGVLVDPDNVSEIASKIATILQKKYPHPLIYQPEQLRKKVKQKFDFDVFERTLFNTLNSLLLNAN